VSFKHFPQSFPQFKSVKTDIQIVIENGCQVKFYCNFN